MPKYIFDQNQAKNSNYMGLLVLPLAVITVFCFGFVLMQPNTPRQPTPKASSTSKSSSDSQTDQSQLQVLPQAQQESIPAIDSNTSIDQKQEAQGDDKAVTKTGPSNTRNLQSAPQNTNSSSTDKTKQTLDNLTQPVKRLVP